jgi:hypothetical protein
VGLDYAEGVEEFRSLHLKFDPPSDTTGIERFEMRFTNIDAAPPYNSFYLATLDAQNGFTYDYPVTHMFRFQNTGTYKVEVISVAQGADNSAANNSVLCEYVIELTALPDMWDSFTPEKVFYRFNSDMLELVIDYHYKGMLVPDVDTYIVDTYFRNGATRYMPQAVANRLSEKGRLYINAILPPGESVGMDDFVIDIGRYTVSIDAAGKRVKLAMAEPVGFDWERLNGLLTPFGEDSPFPGRAEFAYHDANINGVFGAPFAKLILPATVNLYADGPDLIADGHVSVDVLWNETDYDPNSVETQTIHGYVQTEQYTEYTEYPAWVPEVITAEVLLTPAP